MFTIAFSIPPMQIIWWKMVTFMGRDSSWLIFIPTQQIIVILLVRISSWIIQHFEMDGSNLARLEMKGFNNRQNKGQNVWMRVNNTDSLFDFLTILESKVAEGKDRGTQYNVETNKARECQLVV